MTQHGVDRFDRLNAGIVAWVDAMDEALWALLLAHPGRHAVFARMLDEMHEGTLLLFPSPGDLGASPAPPPDPGAENALNGHAPSRTTRAFRRRFDDLSADLRGCAHEVNLLLLQRPAEHANLRLQEVSPEDQLWSVRIARSWHGFVRRTGADNIWLWLGRNDDFLDLLTRR